MSLDVPTITSKAAAIKAKVESGRNVEIKVVWFLADDVIANAVTWTGVPFTSRRGKLQVEWKDAASQPQGKTDFPHPSVKYVSIDVTKDVPAMPGKLGNEEEESSHESEEEVVYKPYKPSTWAVFVDNSDPVMLHTLEHRLRIDFNVLAGASTSKESHFQALMEWVKAAREMTDWDKPGPMLTCGEKLVELLRDVISHEAGLDVAELHLKLNPEKFPDDKYGAIQAKMLSAAKDRKAGVKKYQRRGNRPPCDLCGRTTHQTQFCWLKNPDKAPEHLRDKIRAEAKDKAGFHVGGSGTLKKSN